LTQQFGQEQRSIPNQTERTILKTKVIQPYPFMLHIIWSIIVGFVAGLIASAVFHEHHGFIVTTLLGIVGSIVGGLIARLFSKPADGSPFHPAGFLLSIVGALIVLFIMSKIG
jgi:uncharacterized membrane protein YeaQ/YmgE (transglycosylase-associated protein family)